MKLIPLTQGKFAKVDDVDFEWVVNFKWGYTHGYARRIEHDYTNGWRERTAKRIYMHRLILDNPEGLVDHINQDKLDNRRSNLRLADKSLNARNSKIRIDNSSGFKGVYKRPDGTHYSQVKVNGKTHTVGSFKSALEAHQARSKYVKSLHLI